MGANGQVTASDAQAAVQSEEAELSPAQKQQLQQLLKEQQKQKQDETKGHHGCVASCRSYFASCDAPFFSRIVSVGGYCH